MSIFKNLFNKNKNTKNNSKEEKIMKIAVVATGNVAKKVIVEAQERNIEVVAFGRRENDTAATEYVQKDLFDITKEDLAGFDAVVDAAGGWTAETVGIIPAAAKHLAGLVEGTDTRLVVVGGAGSLFVNPERTLTLAEGPEFPESWLPIANAHSEALQFLRDTKDVKWTYISPAADFQAEGERSGEYTLAGEDFTLNSKGESTISYADYAIALVDEIVSGNHIQERISVVSK